MADNDDITEGVNFEIVFVGRSNVGKSSLIRELTGQKVRVGKRPGVTLKPTQIRFSDLLITDMPGFGFMSGVKERKQDIVKDQIVRYIERGTERIRLAVMVVDGPVFVEVVDRWESRNEIPIDLEMYDFLRELGIDTVVAVNKMDKLKEEEQNDILDGIADKLGMLPPWRQWIDSIAPISAKQGKIKPLNSIIRQRLHAEKRDDLFRYF
ncbi:GTP-binding protein EngB [Methanolobus chelungpuianus]|uniref:Probable GTP-binding protein EngB n=1 Tax=Methanolobus chelungpuianus TaxID=502115 RepID=A0AAE3HC97_9EURY|nr:GTP-binding protein EngB [Methanolobus chelungpuianus]MCQ6963610.1 GTP-binding protein [Methanolobus chelungpuianus]